MNAKFFDLKKEKQDRMINAAVKVFALNGYTHASTDDIVAEAHISKGLLFHYFESKLGVYTFIYDYMVKYLSLELSSAVDPAETDYFSILKQIEAGKMESIKAYPYMILFLDTCEGETVREAVEAIAEPRETYHKTMEFILAHAVLTGGYQTADGQKILKMMDYSLKSVMAEKLKEECSPEEIYRENVSYIDLIAKLFD